MFFNGKKSKEILTTVIQALQQPGGVLRLINGLREGAGATRADSGQQQSGSSGGGVGGGQDKFKSGGKSAASKSPRARPSEAAEKPKSKPATQAEPLRAAPTAANESNNEDSEDYEADYTSEEGESVTIVKRKPKKI